MNTNRLFARFFNFFTRFPVKKNRITLIEKLGTGKNGSLFDIKEECEKRGLDFEYNIINREDYEISLSGIPVLLRLLFRKAHMLATSSFVFLNDNFLPLAYMEIPDEMTIVQVWHGLGSFKKFGASSEEDPDLLKCLRAANERVTHILASSQAVRDNYAEAFMVPPEKVITIGAPQADYYFRDHDLDSSYRDLYQKYPKLQGKKLALYAPTFRDDPERDKALLESFDFEAFENELGSEYALAVRLHPHIRSARVPESVADLSDYPDVRKLLCMTDLLIADYSSITVEYALLDRPIVLYAFDREWYLNKDRNFYFDYEKTAPGPIAESMEDLIDIIRESRFDLDKGRAFAALHNSFFDADSAGRVVDYYFGKKERIGTMKIIAGLGNPTDEYKNTRHNVGFMSLDILAREAGISLTRHQFKSLCGAGFIGGQRVLLMKPLTYMNLSGDAVAMAAEFFKIEPEDLLVIYDDISIEPGMLRIRTKGSAGGHNGMKDIIRKLGYDTFPRIRVGIGGEKHPGQDLADYVLGKFSDEEKKEVDKAAQNAAAAARMFAAGDLAEAMNRYSSGKKKRKKAREEEEN